MFLASKLLALLAQPLHWVIALLAVSLLLTRRMPRSAKRLQILALALLLVVGWQPLPDLLVRQLERHYAEFAVDADLSGYAGVVVLGGALDAGYIAQSHQQPALNASAERMIAAAALARRHPGLRLVFSGGEGDLFGSGPSEAERARRFFAMVGVPAGQLQLESRSRNTYENAVFSAQLPGVDTQKRWLLLTSAWHMPRSMASFQKAGWNVTAYPVDFRTGDVTPWTAYSLTQGIEQWQLALREGLGLIAYKLAGRS